MDLITPGIGLIFWMTVSFSIILFILGKFAWKPILNGLKDRENSIEEALLSAQKAKEDMTKLKSDNEKILDEARAERNNIIKEGKDFKDKIVNEAKTVAEKEADKIIQGARKAIENEKLAAIEELKNQVAVLSIDIAEKILKEKLGDKEQKDYLEKILKDVKLN